MKKLQTNVPSIYAIGDVIKGQCLHIKAEEEGVFVAEQLAVSSHISITDLFPGVVLHMAILRLHPLVIHKKEKNQEQNIKTGNFPFKASGSLPSKHGYRWF